MSSVTYVYDPGTTVYVLIAGSCAGTYSVHAATVIRVEIKITQTLTTIQYVCTKIDDNSFVTVAEADVFVDKPTAAAEAVTRYQALFV